MATMPVTAQLKDKVKARARARASEAVALVNDRQKVGTTKASAKVRKAEARPAARAWGLKAGVGDAEAHTCRETARAQGKAVSYRPWRE